MNTTMMKIINLQCHHVLKILSFYFIASSGNRSDGVQFPKFDGTLFPASIINRAETEMGSRSEPSIEYGTTEL